MEFRLKAFLPSEVVETVHVSQPGLVEGGTFIHATMSLKHLPNSEVKRRHSVRRFPKSLCPSKLEKREGPTEAKFNILICAVWFNLHVDAAVQTLVIILSK